jgi:PAS domain S-box-containing protein
MTDQTNTLEKLRAENAALRRRVAALQHQLASQTTGSIAAAAPSAPATTSPGPRATPQCQQAFLAGLLEHAPSVLFVKDRHERYTLVNQRFATCLHCTVGDIVGKTDADLFPPEVAADCHTRTQAVLASGAPTTFEHRLTLYGETHACQTTLFPVFEAGGGICAVGGITADMTERKRTEAALHRAYSELQELNQHVSRSRDLLRTLFDGMHDGLMLIDGSGVVLTVNQALASLFDIRPEHLVGQEWEQLCRRMSPAFPGLLAMHTLRDGRARRRRERLHRPDGQVRILDLQTMPLHNVYQAVDQVILHSVDVTEQLQFEALMVQNEKFSASSKLVATVAHEVNSPLQAIQNLLFLASTDTDEQRATSLALIGEEIERISSIVGQLLSLYRPDSGTEAPVDINSLIERVLLLSGGTLAKSRIQVRRALNPHLPLFFGLADQLTQVVLNIIVNAIDAMPEGGTLHLHTGVQQHDYGLSWLVVEIGDSGMGIAPEAQAHIFTPFFTTKAEGTGLGLAISKQIIEQHGGDIALRSAPGRGSTFIITLPLNSDIGFDTEELG